MDLKELTIKKAKQGLENKEFSAVELAEEYFKAIEKGDKKINAYLSTRKEKGIEQAREIDQAVENGLDVGNLGGIPIAVKDNINIEGEITTAASKLLNNFKSPYDATVIKKLKSAGAVFLGKTNLDEFAMGSSTENSAFKITKNPRDLERVPGGSSGGSAAAVAADLCVASLGSDTGGSIREPASFCGVVGLKPTYGAVSRYGLLAMASSLDQIGPITKTVEDAKILFSAIKGNDTFDSTSSKKDIDLEIEEKDVKNLIIGLPKEYFIDGIDSYTRAKIDDSIENFKKLGIKFKEISLPRTKYALHAYYIIMPAEVSANLSRFDGIRFARNNSKPKNLLDIYLKTRGEGFGDEVKRRIILGTFVLSSGYYDAYYAKAQKVRRLIKEDFDIAFDPASNYGVDAILTPVAPIPAFKIGEKTKDPLEMYLSDIFTITANLAGLPALAVPTQNYYKSKDLPVGFQLIGKPFQEKEILGLGELYDKNFNQ